MIAPTTARTEAALEFDSFSYAYNEVDQFAIEQVSLRVDPGEFVLVCGDSGSGKSTFLRAISGLVPHHFGGAAAGEARICGCDLRESRAGELAAYCGTLFQDPEAQSVMDGVHAEIAFPLENIGLEAGEVELAVSETAAVLGSTHLLDRRCDELSGGELQRVVLAAALATRPKVLVLDEPTSQLDPVAADELLATLERLCRDHGTTVVLADHRIERALSACDRVIAFASGKVVADCPPQTFLEQAAADARLTHLLPPLAELFVRAEIRPLPLDARAARATLEPVEFERAESELAAPAGPVVLEAKAITHRYRAADRDALSGVNLTLHAGEKSVLLGANGSGKSTLLQIAHGVATATSGAVERSGEVALLLQNPNDYLIHECVADEAPIESLDRYGLTPFLERDPRDLSGGERQRLALAIVTQDRPAALLLDEPTRGMDAKRKEELATMLDRLAAGGTAVLVATHDVEFAARFASRAILLGDGRVLRDAPAGDVLAGGWHFSTAVARLLPGSGALTPEQGVSLLVAGAER